MDREGQDGDGRRMVRDFIPQIASKQILIYPAMENDHWITYSKKQRTEGIRKTKAMVYLGARLRDRDREQGYLQLRRGKTTSKGSNAVDKMRHQQLTSYIEDLGDLRTITQPYTVRNKAEAKRKQLQRIRVD